MVFCDALGGASLLPEFLFAYQSFFLLTVATNSFR